MTLFDKNRRSILTVLAALVGAGVGAGVVPGGPLPATAAEDDPGGGRTGLKVPRFASLRAAEVNVRTGPGMRYPVDWIFVQRNMPVEITAEFETWRKIRDVEGTEGWVHRSMLAGRRTVVVRAGIAPLRRDAAADAPPIARVEPGVIGRLLSCREDWCRVEMAGLRGWVSRQRLFGVYPDERFD